MRRRTFLAASSAGIATGLAGCQRLQRSGSSHELGELDIGNDDTDADSEDGEPAEEPTVDIFETVEFADPYVEVDWESYGRHKAQFHVHPHYGDIGPPQEVYDRYVDLGYEVINVQPKDDLDHGKPWPLEEMGEMHDEWESRYPEDDGVVALPGVEYENPQHLVGLFTEVMRDDLDAAGVPGGIGHPNPQYETARYVIDAGATPETVEPLLFLAHVGRYRASEHWEDPWDEEWLSHYDRMFQMDPVLGLEAISYSFSYDDRDLWDHLLAEATPDRPVIGTSVDDIADLETADRGWVTFYLSNEEFSPSDQQSTQEAVWEALVSGRTSFSTTSEPGMEAPTIERIERDDDARTITIDGAGHDVIEWVSHGDVVETGPTIEYDTDVVGEYVRAQLVDGDPDDPTTITCTQAWHFAQE